MFRAALISMFITSTAFADTWTVDDDGKADFDNIQAAVDASSDGDEIIVMPGTYTSTADEVVNMLGKAVWLHSSDGSETTIINGEGSRRGILCNSGETSKTIIDGFTITNGSAEVGGGMSSTSSSPTLTDCTFTDNTSSVYGGGMYNWNSEATLSNCTFDSNTARYGGAMYNYNSNPTLTNCTFDTNTADWGGGMYNYNSNSTLTNCSFTNNSVPLSGNTADYSGGGMYNRNSSSPTLTNCSFENNSAEDGGGMRNYYSSPTLTNCTFDGNSADYYGGGMYNFPDSSPTLDGCIFTNNTASYGGGMGNHQSNPTLTGATVCGNTPDQIYGDYTDGGGNTIQDVCALAGACCLPDGTCLNVDSEKVCESLSGIYNGDEVYCFESPCVPAEACCLDDVTCIDLIEDLCVLLGGDFQSGSTCAASPCARACCFEDKICLDMLISECSIVGGDSHEFRMCESSPCVTSWTVDDDGKADFNNIQAAVDAATDGDEITVMPGTYTSTQDGHVVYVVDKSITIRSVDPTDPEIVASTIIDGQGVRRGIACANTTAVAMNDSTIDSHFTGQQIHPGSTNSQVNQRNDSGAPLAKCFEGEDLNRKSRNSNERTGASLIRIEGFTIVNGYAAEFDYPSCGWSGSDISGGGILCVCSNLFISNCFLSANSGYQGGAIGLLMPDGGASVITGCQITGNSTFDGEDVIGYTYEWGAGIWAMTPYDGVGVTLEISDCTVADNTSHYVGGGIGTFYVDVSLTNCTIQNNSVENYENEDVTDLWCGGVHIAEGNALIEGCSFIGNKGLFGGALLTQLQPGNGESLVLEVNNCLFDNNIAEGYHDVFGNDACGGAVVLNHYDNVGAETGAYITNCEFINNSATIGGGVILGMPPWEIYNASATLTGCVFKGNSAVSYGGGMWVAEKAVAEVYSTVVCGNTPNWITGPWINGGDNTIDLYCLDDCPDLNGDGDVGVADLLAVVGDWGASDSLFDVNSDGIVDVMDLLIIMDHWGPCE